MGKIKFTSDQISKMKAASTIGHNGWALNALKPVKAKIKKRRREDLQDICCYCQRDTTGEYNMVLDIEHIVPKSVRPRHMFTMKNLTVSCKRCNMQIKRARTDFLAMPITSLPKRIFKSKYYKFVHPNLDEIENHILRNVVQRGRIRFIKYSFPNNSTKGKFTYKYFELRELEIDSANTAQGRKNKNSYCKYSGCSSI